MDEELNCVQNPEPVQMPAPVKNAKAAHVTQKDYLMIITSVVCALTFSFWGLMGVFKIGWTVSFSLFLISGFVYLKRKGKKCGAFGCTCGVLSLGLSAVFTLSDSSDVCVCAFFLSVASAVFFFCALSGTEIPVNEISAAGLIVKKLLDAFGKIPFTVRSLKNTDGREKGRYLPVLLGVVCAVPVLFVVLPLLIKSDAAFEGLVGSLRLDTETIPAGIFYTLILIPLIISFFFALNHSETGAGRAERKLKISAGFSTAFLSVLSLCYLVYVFSLLAYFVSAFSGILPANYSFSYSEYARRGFFELCTIAAINLVIIYFAVTFSGKTDGRHAKGVIATGLFICLFTVFIIVTAFAKMVMYIKAYGMTELRISTSAFMLFILILFGALAVKIFNGRVKLMHAALVSASVIVIVLGCGRLNAFVASYNYNAYISGKLPEMDVIYLYELGNDGVPYLQLLTKSENSEIAEKAKACLSAAIQDNYNIEYSENEDPKTGRYHMTVGEKYNYHFYEMNLPGIRAYRVLDSILKKNPDYVNEYDTDICFRENDYAGVNGTGTGYMD